MRLEEFLAHTKETYCEEEIEQGGELMMSM